MPMDAREDSRDSLVLEGRDASSGERTCSMGLTVSATVSETKSACSVSSEASGSSSSIGPYLVPPPPEDFVRQRKICVFGYENTGKSSLVQQFVSGTPHEGRKGGLNRMCSRPLYRNGLPHLVHVLDTEPQDELGFFDPQFTIGTDAYVLVYSVTDRESFLVVQRIYQELWAYTPLVPFILVANKVDEVAKRQVSFREGLGLAARWRCPYAECSSRSPKTVAKIFEGLLDRVDECYGSDTLAEPRRIELPKETKPQARVAADGLLKSPYLHRERHHRRPVPCGTQ